ncbi:MAG: hypothetical protein MPJ50_14110 [Pirellulales bacterium]|nr:hypothetical protein [Pirellulales bacterium]
MSSVSKPPNKTSTRRGKPTFVTTAYDLGAGWLLAFLVFVGVVLFCVFVIWLTNQTFSSATTRPIIPAEQGGGDPEGTDDRGLDLDMPMADQIAQETDLDMEEIEESFTMLEDVAGLRMAQLTNPFESEVVSGGQSGGSTGTGDDQRLGYGPGNGGGVRREDRWIILYDETSLATYARQLDHFKIEIGAIGRGEVFFLSNLSAATPSARKANPDVKEERLRFSWTSGTLQQYDRNLLRNAGVAPTGMFIVHFYPADVEQELAYREQGFQGKKGTEIRRTWFRVQSDGNGGYEYVVVDQDLL